MFIGPVPVTHNRGDPKGLFEPILQVGMFRPPLYAIRRLVFSKANLCETNGQIWDRESKPHNTKTRVCCFRCAPSDAMLIIEEMNATTSVCARETNEFLAKKVMPCHWGLHAGHFGFHLDPPRDDF